MSEVPHCPECGRADKVVVRQGPGYQWFCTHPACLQGVIKQSDVRDKPFMRMSSSWRKSRIESLKEQGYSDDCKCNWCQRGRPE